MNKISILWFIIIIITVCCNQAENRNLHFDGDDQIVNRIGYMVNDRRVGEWREFRRGRLFQITNYNEKGMLHGRSIAFEICSGKVMEEGMYENGVSSGLWYFYQNGILVTIREHFGDSSSLVYHNPKFKNTSEIPPSPEVVPKECEDLYEY